MSGDPIETPHLLERLRHKGSAGLGFGGRSFGEAWNSLVGTIVGTHHFVELHGKSCPCFKSFFCWHAVADFAIRTTREGLLKIFLL